MNVLLNSILATIIVSLLSFVGIFTLALSNKQLNKIVLLLVALSAGALMGGAFLHLIPETVEEIGIETAVFYTLVGFSGFFIIERFLHWHHCHKDGKCKVHMFTYMSLIGDGVHNFIDGLAIGAAFFIDTRLGITTTLAVIAHEIPQEFGDFGILIHGGFSKAKALLYNFFSSLTAILGAIIGVVLANFTENFIILLPITAGGFIYIAASDLIPELHKEHKLSKSTISFLMFLIGIFLMYGIKLIFEH